MRPMHRWLKIVCNQLNTVEGKRKNRQFLFYSKVCPINAALTEKEMIVPADLSEYFLII
jgi:hypothetical protein